jgi:competence protein ComK
MILLSLVIPKKGDERMVFDDQVVVEEYEINPLTMVIFPYEYGNKTYSRIIEFEEEIFSPFKPTDLVKRGCEYNFTDYNASKKVTGRLTRVTHKAPIAIDLFNSVYLLPTKSPNKPNCIWVSYEHVVDYKRNDSQSTIVIFRNHQSYILPLSYSSFYKQLLRTADLRTKIANKLREKERKADSIFGHRYSDQRLHNIISERYR